MKTQWETIDRISIQSNIQFQVTFKLNDETD